MVIGIYALYWEIQDLVYIGLSQNIANRYTEHLYKLRNNKHTNYKVQHAYNEYGEPNLIILEECSLDELNDKEIFWTNEFDSINNGLNIIEAGQVGWGVNSNASKYTKRQILKVFSLLYSTNLSYTEIGARACTEPSLASDISNKNTHLWLQKEYPEKYILATRSRLLAQFCNKLRGIVLAPDGTLIKVYSSRQVYNHPLLRNKNYENTRPSINKLLDGRLKSYLGFKLVNNPC